MKLTIGNTIELFDSKGNSYGHGIISAIRKSNMVSLYYIDVLMKNKIIKDIGVSYPYGDYCFRAWLSRMVLTEKNLSLITEHTF